MFVSVDLPIPGEPPSSTSEPGTSPPPSTRSSSPMPVDRRRTGAAPTSRSGTAQPGALGRPRQPPARPRRGRPRPRAPRGAGMRSSTSVFQAPHGPGTGRATGPTASRTPSRRETVVRAIRAAYAPAGTPRRPHARSRLVATAPSGGADLRAVDVGVRRRPRGASLLGCSSASAPTPTGVFCFLGLTIDRRTSPSCALGRGVDDDRRAGRELLAQDEVGERVLDVALDRPAQRAARPSPDPSPSRRAGPWPARSARAAARARPSTRGCAAAAARRSA